MDKQLEKIISYLNNNMTAAERTDFEKLMRENETLAEEVEIYRGLQGFLHRENPVLESKLEQLGTEFNAISGKKKKPSLFNPWGIALLALAVVFLIYFAIRYSISEPTPNDFNQPSIIEDSTSPPSVPQQEVVPPIETEKPPKTTPKQPNNQPIADAGSGDFTQNTTLESLITLSVRNGSDKVITIIEPIPDAIFEKQSLIRFSVSGTTNIPPDYRLIIYSNRAFDVENDYRILDKRISGSMTQDLYSFGFNAEIPLKKGLYYFIIQEHKSQEMLYISRFSVQ